MKMKKNKRSLVQKYGKDAEQVMYGRATNMAKKQSESMENDKLREMIKDALKNPKAADLNKDGKLSDYEAKRGVAIEKNLDEINLDLTGGTEKDTDADIAGVVGAESALGLEEGASTEEKRIVMQAIKRLAKYRGVGTDEAKADLIRAAKELGDLKEDSSLEEIGMFHDPRGYDKNAASEDEKALQLIDAMIKKGVDKEIAIEKVADKFNLRTSYLQRKMGEGDLNETQITEDKQEAADELQMIMDQLYELSDQAKMIFRNNFPMEYSRLDAYGALDFGTSSNRYDVTLEGTLENLDMEDDDEDMMQEDLDLGHQDNEPHMLKADLYRIGKYAMELYQMVDGFEGQGEVDFPSWWQAKISNAKEAIVGAKHYLDFELKEPQIDAMVGVAQDVEAIDEEEVGEVDLLAAKIQKAMNAAKGDEAKTYQLQRARTAMNKGDLETAKKIVGRYLEEAKYTKRRERDEVDELLDPTPSPVVTKANSKIVDVATMAKSLLDIYNDFKAKEKINFEANSYFRNALSFLEKAAKSQIDKETKGVDVQTEDYDALVNKIKKQGRSEKAAKAIAGAVASYKAKGGGKGPTAKQK